MDFSLTNEERAFRDRIRRFYRDNPPPANGGDAGRRAYRRLLAERGWLTMHWPREHGGRGAGHLQQVIFKEESFTAGVDAGGFGTNMIGPTLMLHGSDEQRAEHLPPIVGDEVIWCQGFSEPGAGSDLAALQTRAVKDGDDYVISGQKIWTSNAHRADWIFLLARTDPDAPKHRGISALLVDLRSPGITISPLVQMTGEHGFNQVFFGDVRVPLRNRVGDEHRGWYVATTTLDFERSGIERYLTADRDLRRVEDWQRTNRGLWSGRPGATAQRLQLADLRVGVEVGRLLAYRVAWMQGRGMVPNYEASMSKMFNSDLGQAVARAGIAVFGVAGQLRGESAYAPLDGRPAFRYLDSVRLTIGQGTGEIQRNVIAQRGLGLPRT
ncbi:MAG: acyl-CoA dehydrogenase family protein [Dehalococcoidia bacterium]